MIKHLTFLYLPLILYQILKTQLEWAQNLLADKNSTEFGHSLN
jgi:hypothetical protein